MKNAIPKESGPTLKLLTFEHQPNFPDEDLTESNSSLIAYRLETERTDLSYAHCMDDCLVPVFKRGHEALLIRGLPSEDSRRSYDVFTQGFAAAEYALTCVRMQMYHDTRAVEQFNEIFLRSETVADFEVSNRYMGWLATHGNLYSVVAQVGIARGDEIKHTQARTMGACIATEMQRGGLLIS